MLIGDEISITFYARWEIFNSNSKIMDFNNGHEIHNIVIGNEAETNNLICGYF